MHDAADDVVVRHAVHIRLAILVQLAVPVVVYVVVEFLFTVEIFVLVLFLFLFLVVVTVEQFLEGLRAAVLAIEFQTQLGVRLAVVRVGVAIPVEFVPGIQRTVRTIRRATVMGKRRSGRVRTVRRGRGGRRCNADRGGLSGNGR